jgi:predicted GIY-YIG superfamily endonuclease
MIRKMADLPAGRQGKKEWSVYVLRCGDGSLYTGIAKNVLARLARHNKGKGAAYTRSHLPVELVYQEIQLTRSGALIREASLKRLSRARKEVLVRPSSPSASIGDPAALTSKTLDSRFRGNDAL